MNKSILIVLCLVVAVDAASFGLLLPVVPFFVNQLTGSFNAIEVTSVTATYSGLQFLGAPVIGRLSDRWGRRVVLTVAVAISALALIGQGALHIPGNVAAVLGTERCFLWRVCDFASDGRRCR